MFSATIRISLPKSSRTVGYVIRSPNCGSSGTNQTIVSWNALLQQVQITSSQSTLLTDISIRTSIKVCASSHLANY